jgi:hypothetical protein
LLNPRFLKRNHRLALTERIIRDSLALLSVTNQADVRWSEAIPKMSVKLAQAWVNQWILDEGEEFLPSVILYNLIKGIIFYLLCFVSIIFISANTASVLF